MKRGKDNRIWWLRMKQKEQRANARDCHRRQTVDICRLTLIQQYVSVTTFLPAKQGLGEAFQLTGQIVIMATEITWSSPSTASVHPSIALTGVKFEQQR